MSYVNNYIQYNKYYHAKIGLENHLAYSNTIDVAMEGIDLRGLFNKVKDTLKRLWQSIKELFVQFKNTILKWFGLDETSKNIKKAIWILESGALKDVNVIAEFRKLAMGHMWLGKSALYFLDHNGKPHDINNVLKNTINTIDFFNKVRYNQDVNSEECHLYIGGHVAVYKFISSSGSVTLKDEYFENAVDPDLISRIERDILGYDVAKSSTWETNNDHDNDLQKSVLNKLSIKDLVLALKSIDKNYSKASSFYQKVFNDTNKYIERCESELNEFEKSNVDDYKKKIALRVQTNLPRFVVKLSTIPINVATNFMRFIQQLTSKDVTHRYINTTKPPGSPLLHLSKNPNLIEEEKGLLKPRLGWSNTTEFLPKRVSFGTNIIDCCTALYHLFTGREDEDSEAICYRDFYVYEGRPSGGSTTYIKPEIVAYALHGVEHNETNEICVTTPIPIKEAGMVRVWFKRPHDIIGKSADVHSRSRYIAFKRYRRNETPPEDYK